MVLTTKRLAYNLIASVFHAHQEFTVRMVLLKEIVMLDSIANQALRLKILLMSMLIYQITQTDLVRSVISALVERKLLHSAPGIK